MDESYKMKNSDEGQGLDNKEDWDKIKLPSTLRHHKTTVTFRDISGKVWEIRKNFGEPGVACCNPYLITWTRYRRLDEALQAIHKGVLSAMEDRLKKLQGQLKDDSEKYFKMTGMSMGDYLKE